MLTLPVIRQILPFRSLVSVAKRSNKAAHFPLALAISIALSGLVSSDFFPAGLVIPQQALAASTGAQPVLKKIDPSAAKLDAPAPPEASVDPGRKFNQSNPFNSGIQGRPLAAPPQQFQSPPPSSGMQSMPGMLSPQLDESQSLPQGSSQSPGQLPGQSQMPVSAADEQRVTRLEKQAFGNTYPEHEVDDRLEHLEKEVLGGSHDGQVVDRIARLEQKLLGGSAFGGSPTNQAVLPSNNQPNNLTAVNMSGNNYIPVPASNYPAPVAVPAPSPPQTQYQQYPPSQPQYSPTPNNSSNNQAQGQRPQIPTNHLPPGQVAVPPAWNSQPNFSPRAYGLGPAPSPTPSARPGTNNRPANAPRNIAHDPARDPVRVAQNNNQSGYSNTPLAPVASSLVIDASVVANSLNYDGQAGDYLPAIRRLNNNNASPAYAHWRQFPVKVRLPLGSPESWQRNLEAVVARWDQYVPVKIALPSESSNVDVLWVNQLPPKALGVCRLNIVNGQMQVWVYLLRPSFYAADVPERTLAGVFTREMGHALGLFGKSEKPSDLMYAAENGSSNTNPAAPAAANNNAQANAKKKQAIKFSGIGVRDINTLKRLYEAQSTPPGLSLEQPLEWATSY